MQNKQTEPDKQGAIVSLTGLLLGFFPLALVGYLSFLMRDDQEQMAVILNFMWIVGGVIIAWVLYTQAFILKKQFSEFNRKASTLKSDLLWGLALAVVLTIISVLFALFFPHPAGGSAFESFNRFYADLAGNPLKAAFFLSISLLLGVSFEEFIRTFTLIRMWEIFRDQKYYWAAILISGLMFGLAHAYESVSAMFSAAVVGIIFGFFYYHKGRLLPLILAHYLYNLTAFLLLIYG